MVDYFLWPAILDVLEMVSILFLAQLLVSGLTCGSRNKSDGYILNILILLLTSAVLSFPPPQICAFKLYRT